jgi:hypothetical protein
LVLPGVWYLLFVQPAGLPPSVRDFFIVGNLLRVGAVWLGSLGIRQWRVTQPAPGTPRIAR